jgi:hypothetical protein
MLSKSGLWPLWRYLRCTPPTSRINMHPTGIGYERVVPDLLRIKGGEHVVKALGLGHYILSKPRPDKKEGLRASTKAAKKGTAR